MPIESWGRLPAAPQEGRALAFPDDPLPLGEGRSLLAHGLDRSYGDVCLNDDGRLVLTRALDRFIAFEPSQGILRCEAGVTLSDVLAFALPGGWFLPVTPGTKFVTVGGALANDVHGKNHHRVGSFGNHVRCFELLRSDGTRRICSPSENPEWFAATIGGLGLTGLVTWVELQLRPVRSASMDVTTVRFGGLREFFALSRVCNESHEYTVAWLDCFARGAKLGRGLFMRANHADGVPAAMMKERVRAPRLSVPVPPPVSAVNGLTSRLFNAAYYPLSAVGERRQHYEPYFYPLDGIGHWNRMYGPRGFYQYQCVVPSEEATTELVAAVAGARSASFLNVLKALGPKPPLGLLSFARPGYTLALDFPNRGADTLRLFERLDAIVGAAGGAIYPAKDARMPGALFRAGYPRWPALEQMRDPQFSSSFWRRVTQS